MGKSFTGPAAASLDPLYGVSEPPPAARYRVVHRPAPFAEGLEPAVAVPLDVGVELLREAPGGHRGPVVAVVELLLERAEEALRPRVVRVAPLPRHRADDAVPGADPLPGSRPVRPAAVEALGHGGVALRQRAQVGQQRRVAQGRAWAQGDRPGRGHAVEAVDDRGEAGLGPAGPEPGDVGDHELVGARG